MRRILAPIRLPVRHCYRCPAAIKRSAIWVAMSNTAGATMALPCLESFTGANSVNTTPATRLAIFYVPIGVVRRGFFPGEQDATIPKFTSSQEEVPVDVDIPVGLHPFETLTPTQQPLGDIKDKVTLITGMGRFYKNGSDVHAQCGSCFLSSATGSVAPPK